MHVLKETVELLDRLLIVYFDIARERCQGNGTYSVRNLQASYDAKVNVACILNLIKTCYLSAAE